MSEEKRKHSARPDSNIGAYILIGIGIIFLLMNLFEINFSRLWPLLLVAVGLYLLMARRETSGAKTAHLNAPVDEATNADVELHLSVGEARVEPLSNRDDLIEADLTYVGDIRFDVSGTENKMVRLRQSSDSTWQWLNPATWFGGVQHYDWRIGLNPHIPMRLNIHGGLGKSDLNLRDLNISSLRVNSGVGEMTVMLPASDVLYDARIEGGLGETRLTIPENTSATLEIRGGVGQITVDTNSQTAVRLKGRGGIGSVSVPARMAQISGGKSDFELGQTGTWETADYETAQHRVTINYEGGVGELRVR